MNQPQHGFRNDPPVALHDRAMDDLRFIRRTMERSGSFTAVPGWGGVLIGALALFAALLAQRQTTDLQWLLTWLATAALTTVIAVISLVVKARRAQVPLSTGPGRKFLLSFLPPAGAAIALTAALYVNGSAALLPGLWLLSYGAAVIAAGTFSVRVIPVMGTAFMVVGALSLGTPAAWADAWMAAGFGGLHILAGLSIARWHGG